MPTYQYRCTECSTELEVVQKFTDSALTTCPECSGSLRKVFNAVGVVFKGSGFYRTDSRSDGKSSNGSKPSSDSSSSNGESKSSGSESKSDSSSGSGTKSDSSSSKSESSSSKSDSSKSSAKPKVPAA